MYSEEIRAKIIEKYNSGVKVSDIAKEFKCAKQTVYNFVPVEKTHSRLPDDEKKRIIELYKAGETTPKISKIINRNAVSVLKVLKIAGVYDVNRDASPEKRAEYGKKGADTYCKNLVKKGRIIYGYTTKIQERDIIEASRSRFIEGICRERNNISPATVKKILKSNNEPTPKTDKSRVHSTTYDMHSDYLKARAYFLYTLSGKTAKEVSAETTLKQQTVYKLARDCKENPALAEKYRAIIAEAIKNFD